MSGRFRFVGDSGELSRAREGIAVDVEADDYGREDSSGVVVCRACKKRPKPVKRVVLAKEKGGERALASENRKAHKAASNPKTDCLPARPGPFSSAI